MKRSKVKTKKLIIPEWQVGLFVSLFYADGGEGYSDTETKEVAEIIDEEHLLSLISVSEPQEGECKLEFITQY